MGFLLYGKSGICSCLCCLCVLFIKTQECVLARVLLWCIYGWETCLSDYLLRVSECVGLILNLRVLLADVKYVTIRARMHVLSCVWLCDVVRIRFVCLRMCLCGRMMLYDAVGVHDYACIRAFVCACGGV